MPSVNIRGLRDSKQLKDWLRAGKKVELRDRDEVIGEIVPKRRSKQRPKWPDFEARAKEIFGDRVLPIVDDLMDDRGRY